MSGLSDALGRDDEHGLRGDMRKVRDAQNIESTIRLENAKRQETNSRRIQVLLALLTALIAISTASSHWSAIKVIFSSITNPPIFQHTETQSPYTATIHIQQYAGNSEAYTRETKGHNDESH